MSRHCSPCHPRLWILPLAATRLHRDFRLTCGRPPCGLRGPQAAEASIPAINQHLAELVAIGVTDFQIEGPAIYSRPAGVSRAHIDEFLIYQAAIILPGGVGALAWGSTEYHEHTSRPYSESVHLAPRFTPYAQ